MSTKKYTVSFSEPLAGVGNWEEFLFSVKNNEGNSLDYGVRISGSFLAGLSVKMAKVPKSEAICASAIEADLLGKAPKTKFQGAIDIDERWYPGYPGELKYREDYEEFSVTIKKSLISVSTQSK